MKSKTARTAHTTQARLDMGWGLAEMLLGFPTWVTEKMMSFTETGSSWHI